MRQCILHRISRILNALLLPAQHDNTDMLALVEAFFYNFEQQFRKLLDTDIGNEAHSVSENCSQSHDQEMLVDKPHGSSMSPSRT
jgi:hypothetical protein